MTTYEYGRNLISEARTSTRARAISAAVGRGWRKLRPLSLPIAGVGCFVGAAFTYSLVAGLIATGFGFFFVEWRAAK